MAEPFKGPFTVEAGRDPRIAPECQKLNRFHVIDASGRFASYERTFDEAQWLCDRLNADSYAEGKVAGLEEALNACNDLYDRHASAAKIDGPFAWKVACDYMCDAIRALATVKP